MRRFDARGAFGALLACVLLAVGVAVVWHWLADAPELPPASERTARGADDGLADPASASREARDAELEATRAPEPAVAPADDDAATTLVTIRGVIVALDADGHQSSVEDGWFVPRRTKKTWLDARARIPVTYGRFSFEMPVGAQLAVDVVWLRDRFARCTTEPAVPDPAVELRLDVELERPVRLHVVDAETRAELKGITLRRFFSPGFPDASSPGRGGTIAAKSLDSPIDLPLGGKWKPDSWKEVFSLHAPGHAYGRVVADYAAGGEVTVALPHSAALEVRIVGTVPPPPEPVARTRVVNDRTAVLRVRTAMPAPPDDLFSGAPATDGPTRIDDLPPGRAVVTLERTRTGSITLGGASPFTVDVLASTEVDLVSGVTAEAELTIAPVKSE